MKELNDEKIKKAISSQLWEVAIHRVRRSFEQTHGNNTFAFGDTNEIGSEIIVGGKNKGNNTVNKVNDIVGAETASIIFFINSIIYLHWP